MNHTTKFFDHETHQKHEKKQQIPFVCLVVSSIKSAKNRGDGFLKPLYKTHPPTFCTLYTSVRAIVVKQKISLLTLFVYLVCLVVKNKHILTFYKSAKNRGGGLLKPLYKAHPPTFCLFCAVFGSHS